MITSAGVGSGLDIESIISQLMQIEREPLNNLDRQQQQLDVSISALGTFKSAISDLSTSLQSLGDTAKFGNYVATSTDEEIFTAEVTAGTRIENHTIEVLSLAKAHQLSSDIYPAGAESSVATGSYSFASGEESFQVTIDGNSNTLLGLRDAINDAEDNTTISASVLNLDGGSRLILSASQTGIENQIQAPAQFSEITAATDAQIMIDTFSASASSNNMNEVIPGVSLDLKSTGTANIETTRDTGSLRERLDDFVTNYNALINTVESLSTGELAGDGTLRSIRSDLSSAFFQPLTVKGQEYTPFSFGLTFDRNGVLSVNESGFSAASAEDTENFISAMTDAETGFSKRLNEILDKYTEPDGFIATKEQSFEARKDSIDSQSERMEYRLEQTEARLRRQFTALDTLMSQLQTTSNYLTDQLSSLNNNNNQN